MLGAVAAVLGTAWSIVEEEVRRTMGERISKEMLDKNITALRAAYDAAKKGVAGG